MILTSLIPVLGTLMDKLLPDPQQQADAKFKLVELAQKGELAVLDADLKLALGQIEVNKEEAKADNFRGGWRPLIGYIFGLALAFQYIINPLLLWVNAAFHLGIVPPEIKLDNMLWELMFGMLGLAGFRSYEKIKRATD